jgi:hypothetical protein
MFYTMESNVCHPEKQQKNMIYKMMLKYRPSGTENKENICEFCPRAADREAKLPD